MLHLSVATAQSAWAILNDSYANPLVISTPNSTLAMSSLTLAAEGTGEADRIKTSCDEKTIADIDECVAWMKRGTAQGKDVS
jgi:hypothetical protein